MEKKFDVVIDDITVRLLQAYRDLCINSYEKKLLCYSDQYYSDELERYRNISLDDLVDDYIINSFNLHF